MAPPESESMCEQDSWEIHKHNKIWIAIIGCLQYIRKHSQSWAQLSTEHLPWSHKALGSVLSIPNKRTTTTNESNPILPKQACWFCEYSKNDGGQKAQYHIKLKHWVLNNLQHPFNWYKPLEGDTDAQLVGVLYMSLSHGREMRKFCAMEVWPAVPCHSDAIAGLCTLQCMPI